MLTASVVAPEPAFGIQKGEDAGLIGGSKAAAPVEA